MSIPTPFNPMGTLGAVEELPSCGIPTNVGTIRTGVDAQVRNMRLTLKVGGLPTTGITPGQYLTMFGSSSGCRRFFRFGAAQWDVRIFTGSAMDSGSNSGGSIENEMDVDINFDREKYYAVINGKSSSNSLRDFTEPAGKVQMFFQNNLSQTFVFRFYSARVYLNGEMVADIVPAKAGDKIVLWDKLRRIKLESQTPLLP